MFEQGISAVWKRDYATSVLRVPAVLPSMATFVGKPNFRVTSTRDPDPLISYHDGWTAYNQNSLASEAAGSTHEMRASVIMKTSDVTSS